MRLRSCVRVSFDRNGNGVMDTCQDLNGDGYITENEILPWDANRDGQPDDERIAMVVHAGRDRNNPGIWTYGGGARGIAVDTHGKLWVGLNGRQQYEVFDEATGEFENIVPVNGYPYGAVIAPNGVLYSTTSGSRYLDAIDTETQTYLGAIDVQSGMYGITVDPAGIIWLSPYGGTSLIRYDTNTGEVVTYPSPNGDSGAGISVDLNGNVWAGKFNADGMLKWVFAEDHKTLLSSQFVNVPGSEGCTKASAVDADGYVWTTSLTSSKTFKIDPTTNQVALTRDTGYYPYNYSDMTGRIRIAFDRADRVVDRDSGQRAGGVSWGTVVLDTDEPAGTNVRLRLRASDNRGTLPSLPWQEVESAVELSDHRGRYLEVEVTLQSSDRNVTPVVRSIVTAPLPPMGISIASPPDGTALAAGTSVVIAGQAHAQPLEVGSETVASNAVTAVLINGTPVEVLDAGGNFFTTITVAPGENVLVATAVDAFGQTATASLTLEGTQLAPGTIDFSRLVDVTASFQGEYGRTSFQEDTDMLYADLLIRNRGRYEADAPLLVGIANLSDPTIQVRGADGLLPDGTPYFDYSDRLLGRTLAVGEFTEEQTLSFHNSQRLPFTYELLVLGKLNEPPEWTSLPTTQAIVGQPYEYDGEARDADQDPLTFSLVTGPSAMAIDAATGQANWTPSANDAGTHAVTLRVSDGRGGVAAQHYVVEVTEAPPNRPPVITSVPVTEATITEVVVGDPELVDLSSWQRVQYELNFQPDANWVVSETGTSVVQRVNADASFLMSDFESSAERIEGTWRVESNSDDDFMGFVFGYQDRGHFYLFDWKQGNQNHRGYAEKGMSVKVFHADQDPIDYDFWPTAGSDNVEVLYHNTIAWQNNTEYRFTLDFQPGQFTITVSEEASGTVLDTIELFDNTYTSGKFGFYNYSQDTVRYEGFTRQSIANYTYHYDVEAIDPDSDPVGFKLTSSPPDMVINPNTGLIAWAPTVDHIGSHAVTVEASDPHGAKAVQTFTILVPPGTIEPRALDCQRAGDQGTGKSRLRLPGECTGSRTGGDHLSAEQRSRGHDHRSCQRTAELGCAKSGLQFDGINDFLITPNLQDQFADESVTLELWFEPEAAGVIVAEVGQPTINSGGWHDSQLEILTSGEVHARVWNLTPVSLGTVAFGTWHHLALRYDKSTSTFDALLDGTASNSIHGDRAAPWESSHGQYYAFAAADSTNMGSGAYFQGTLHDVRVWNRARTTQEILADMSRMLSGSEPGLVANWRLVEGSGATAADRTPQGLDASLGGGVAVNQPSWPIPETVIVRARDSRGAPGTQIFTVTIADPDPNDAPAITSTAPLQATVGRPYVYHVSAEDLEKDPLRFGLSSLPAGMTIDSLTGRIVWTPAGDQLGSHEVTVEVNDGRGGNDAQTFEIEVAATRDNHAPQIVSQPPTTAAVGQLYRYEAVATDADADALSFDLPVKPFGMSVDSMSGVVAWKPVADDVGQHDVVLRVRDGQGGVDLQALRIDVAAINTPPVITSIPQPLATPGQSYRYLVRAQDAEGDVLQYLLTDGPQGMSLDGATGMLAWDIPLESALQFDGDDYVPTALRIDQTASSPGVTMEAWVRPDSTDDGAHYYVIGTDNGGYDWSIYRAGDRWQVLSGEYFRDTGLSVDFDAWQHIAAIFQPGVGIRFYKNGQEAIIPYIDYDAADNPIAIGTNPGYGGRFKGAIDEVRVWNVARSANEIRADMTHRLRGDETGLAGYWPLDEGAGDTAQDLSSAGNHATLGGGNPDNQPTWIESFTPLEGLSQVSIRVEDGRRGIGCAELHARISPRHSQRSSDHHLPAAQIDATGRQLCLSGASRRSQRRPAHL